jgi:penicillin-binding protein 1A
MAPFERFWTLRRDAANAFIRDTEAYRRAVAAGEAEDAVLERLRSDRTFLDSLRQHKMRLEVAMTAVDPETGHVKVWVGSRDFERSAYDHVARARRQPGSTFKPFLYARALEEGFRPDDTLPDQEVSIEMDDGVIWQPTNASGSASGQEVSLRDGLVYSKNTIAAQLVQEVGARDLARTARRLGVRSELEAVPSLALGTSDVSLLEMTSAYAAIAAGGTRRPPVVVTHITDRDGNEVARFEPEADRALDPDVAVTLVDMMRGVVDQGTGTQVRTAFAARGDLAGKTGTTQDGADGWFFLMRPDLVTGAWVGFDDPRVTFRSSYWGQGGHNALRVVGDFNRALQSARLVDTGRTFPTPEEAEDAGPGLWDRFARWVGDTTADWFDGADVPEDYGPRTPNRSGPETGDDPDDWPTPRRDRGQREDIYADNADWLNDAWDELDRIDDPLLREAAREVLRGAAREIARNGWREGWSERMERAQERAMARAQREIEREIDDALADIEPFIDESAGPFADELDDAPEVETTPLEEVPVAPPPAEPDPRYPGRERVPDADGRIGW